MALFGLLWLLGCVDGVSSVVVTGTVYDGHDGDARPLAEGVVTLFDEDRAVIGADEVDLEGIFEIEAPAGVTIYAQISGDGLATSVFKGTTGIDEEVFTIDDGALFAVPEAERQAWASLWEGCPGLDEEGGWIVGEIRLYIPGTDQELPVVTTGFAHVETDEGDRIEACYLDEDGELADPDASNTGVSGQFAIFGVSEEHRWLSVGYTDQGYTLYGPLYQVWVEPGTVAPVFPGYVELPSSR